MISKWIRALALLLLMSFLVASCTSSNEDTQQDQVGLSFGRITGFGSIIMNDIEFDIDDAILTGDGIILTEADLGLGDLCLVQGTYDSSSGTGVATHVTCDDVLEGPVTELVSDTELVVMGHRVFINDAVPTELEGFEMADLAVGHVLEVHGFLDLATGDIQATRLEWKGVLTPDTEVELKGTVTGFNGTDQFTMAGLTVVITDDTEVDDDVTLADGAYVEVKGTMDAGLTTLTAKKIENALEHPLEDWGEHAEVELEGIISDFTDVSNFTVNGIRVDASTATFEDGVASVLANGVKVEVEGTLNEAGVLVADEVEIEHASPIRIEANVLSVSADGTSLDVGFAGDQSLTVHITGATEMRDESSEDDDGHSMQLTDIAVGERVEIRAYEDPDTGDIVASRVEREGLEDANDDLELRGPVDGLDGSLVFIVGIEIDTSVPGMVFEIDDMPVTQADFLAALTAELDAGRTPKVQAEDDGHDGFDELEMKLMHHDS